MSNREKFLLFVIKLSPLIDDTLDDKAFIEATYLPSKIFKKVEKQIPEAASEYVHYIAGRKNKPKWIA
jgi:hypothetical protein